jgi:AraC-like DNA-binding protein
MLESPYYLRDNTGMASDPFSDILKIADARSVISGGFTAEIPWAMQYPVPEKIKFFAIVKGRCWLRLDGEEEPVRVETGDVLIVSGQRPFLLFSDSDTDDSETDPMDAKAVFAAATGPMVQLGERDDYVQIGGHVQLNPSSGNLLSDALPPLIHVRAAAPQAGILQWLLDQLVQEETAGLPGASVASMQIAQLLFVQLLRSQLENAEPFPLGWLRALGDPRIAPALRLMHSDPGRAWHLNELACAVAMSRTTFALHFKTVVGVPPLTYLLNWRMHLAQRALREENVQVSEVALSLGYTSESAFSNAFKRVMGQAPKRYQQEASS